jgi:hypothetical protein
MGWQLLDSVKWRRRIQLGQRFDSTPEFFPAVGLCLLNSCNSWFPDPESVWLSSVLSPK